MSHLEPLTVTPQRRETLLEILQLLEDADEGRLTRVEALEAFQKLAHKVDAVYEVLSHLEGLENQVGERQRELQKAKVTIRNRQERLKDYIKFSMTTTNQNEMRGQTYKFKVSTRQDSKLEFVEPEVEVDQSLMAEFSGTDLVKVKYEWNKQRIKEILKAEKSHEITRMIAKLVPTTTLRKDVITK